MAIHKILYLPNPRLREMSQSISNFDAELQTLIDDMFETMYDVKGLGLAAIQIGVALRLSVIDVSEERNKPLVIINPEIIASSGEKQFDEGCLSVPGAYDKVTRAEKISIKALDRDGVPFEMEAEGLLAECMQHEIDHMNGKLFIDMLSPLKKAMARKKVDKFKRKHGQK